MGRIGAIASEALRQRGEYCCGLARSADPQRDIFTSLDEVLAKRPDVLLDLTTQPDSYDISSAAVANGLCTVIGSSGWSEEQRAALAEIAQRRGVGVLMVPNFSIGATLMMRFAKTAARFFPEAEIVEMHHAKKKDQPSGTARETALRIAEENGKMPPIHSIRLPGLLAHHEVVFGGIGELLTIRHDSFTRESFVVGMLAAVHAVVLRRGLSIGLDSILDELPSPLRAGQ
jgi:4-hydroxy-tetrahydrodipicolinate reductase